MIEVTLHILLKNNLVYKSSYIKRGNDFGNYPYEDNLLKSSFLTFIEKENLKNKNKQETYIVIISYNTNQDTKIFSCKYNPYNTDLVKIKEVN